MLFENYVWLVLLSCVFQAVGISLQKHAVATSLPNLRIDRLFSDLPAYLRATWANRTFLTGWVSLLISAALILQALADGDLTVVLPLSSLGIGLTLLIGILFIGERVTRIEIAGVCVIVAGMALLAMDSQRSEAHSLATAPAVLITLGVIGTAVGVMVFQARRPGSMSREAAYALSAGLLFGIVVPLLKSAMTTTEELRGTFSVSDAGALWTLVQQPTMQLAAVAHVIGTIVSNAAYSNGRISMVSPIRANVSDVIAITAGFWLLHEAIVGARVSGIALTLIGTAAIMFGSRIRSFQDDDAGWGDAVVLQTTPAVPGDAAGLTSPERKKAA